MSFPAYLISYKYSINDLYRIAPDFSSFIGGLAYFDNATKTITVKTGGIFGGYNAISATDNFASNYSSGNRRDYFIIEVKS
jgi:hypothetical protein